MNTVKVFGVAGTARVESLNRKLLSLAASIAPEFGAEVDVFDLRLNPIELYDLDSELAAGFPANVKQLRERVLAADAVLFASPEYNAGYTPVLKSVLDWGSRKDGEVGNVWAGKPVVVITASPGAFGGVRGSIALKQVLLHVGMTVLPESATVAVAHKAFDDNGQLVHDYDAAGLKSAVEGLVKAARLFKNRS